MSPEVLMKSKDRQGYDGRSVDVWASGILLFVMLMVRWGWEGGAMGIPTPDGIGAVMWDVWLKGVCVEHCQTGRHARFS